MVKKKGKSKRTSFKDKYKIQKRVTETHRKRRKQTKKDVKAGIVRQHDLKKKKDPGIPNSWPFKEDLLKEIQRQREKDQEKNSQKKEKRKNELRSLKEHQQQGGTARTIEELMERVNNDHMEYGTKNIAAGREESKNADKDKDKSDGTVEAGQASRRAYLKELKKVVDSSDVLLQVLDARDPIGSRIHSSIENIILSRTDKRMVLVLNKIDLVPKSVVKEWLNTLRRSHPTIAIKANKSTMSSSSSNDNKKKSNGGGGDEENSNVPVGMDGLLQLLKNYARTGGVGGSNKKKSKGTIVVGIVGYPNVGKSSIINALKRCRAVGVSSRPGFTTSMQEVVLDKNVRLLDSPGVVFNDNSSLLNNCVDADTIVDPIPSVERIIQRCTPKSLIMTYNIAQFEPGNVMMFLSMVAKSYGRVLKGGVPDKVAAARAVLRDWNSGKIPYFTSPPSNEMSGALLSSTSDAVIVKAFGPEFDITKFDDQIMQSLEDSSKMDFVEMKEDKDANNNNNGQTVKAREAAIRYLTGENQDDDDDDEDMEEDDDDDEMDDQDETPRANLAGAEDYNFDDL